MSVEQMDRVGVPSSDPTEEDIAESISLTLEDFPPDRITVDDWTAPAWYGHDGWVIEHVWYTLQLNCANCGSPDPHSRCVAYNERNRNLWDDPRYF